MLRVAAQLRDKTDEHSVTRRREVWAEILEHEAYTITQKVANYGYRQHGRAAVDTDDRGDIVSRVMRRILRLMETFQGREVGQLRAAINQAVEWEVLEYGRNEARKRQNEFAVEPSAWDPGSHSPEDRAGFDPSKLITASATGDRIEMIEQLRILDVLQERERQVLVMRASGHSSKEVATELELTPANVDQIYHRALKRVRAVSLAEQIDD